MTYKNYISGRWVSSDSGKLFLSDNPADDTPVPAGLSAVQILALIENLRKSKIIGADIVELNPKFDKQNITGHLASRIIAEIVYSTNT